MTIMPLSLKLALSTLAVAGLSACAQAPAPEPLPAQDVVIPATGIAGLTTREPTLFCKSETYTPYLGQPAGVIPTLGISHAYRVVEYRGIAPQDYDPMRILFNLDAAGNIASVDCG